MAFKIRLLGHKPEGQRGEMAVARARKRALNMLRETPAQTGEIGGLPVAGAPTPEIKPFFPFMPPATMGDGRQVPTTSGVAPPLVLIPFGGANYRKRVATARARLNEPEAAGEGIAVARVYKPDAVTKPLATATRPVVQGDAQIPNEIRQPFTLLTSPLAIDARRYQAPPTAGYVPIRFF